MIPVLFIVGLLALPLLSMAEKKWSKKPGNAEAPESFWIKQRDWILLVSMVLAMAAFHWWPGHHTELKPLEAKSSGAKYLDEFKHYKFAEALPPGAPNGGSRIEEELGPKWIPVDLLRNCHTFWLVLPDGEKRIVAKADEMDSGSGRSFSWGWSKDSKAVFFKGGYRKLDCNGPPGGFSMIYTIEDETNWDVRDQVN